MDRRFVVQESYANADRDHSAQSYMAALRLFCPRYLDAYSVSTGSPGDFLPSGGRQDRVVIPVGGIEFVGECLRAQRDAGICGPAEYVDVEMTPIEVPDALLPYVGRTYERMLGRDIPDDMLDGRRWFVKDAGKLKRWNSALYDFGGLGHLIDPDVPYVVSERVSFVSEWRVFVHEDEIVSCQNYAGGVLEFPDAGTLKGMLRDYAGEGHPRAYTLDVGVMRTDDGSLRTVPIEVHPFVSCGLYGMFDMLIPDMLEAGYEWYLHRA